MSPSTQAAICFFVALLSITSAHTEPRFWMMILKLITCFFMLINGCYALKRASRQ